VPASRARRCPGIRRALPLAALLTLSAGALGARLAPAAQHTSRHRATAPAQTAAGAHPLLSAGQAAALANRTHRRVVVSALTTQTSQTTANPDGSLTVTESAQPVRARSHGGWAALSPALHQLAGGRIAPALTTSAISLSGGGTSPLVILQAAGRTLSLSWPGTLPTPTLSGDTATYPGVLPGVDLVLTVDSQGGFADTLVVHSAAAAANPALASLSLGFTTPDLALASNGAGGVAAASGPGSPAVITAQAPQIWDSTPPPAGMKTVTAPDGTVLDAATGLPAYSSVSAPGAAANIAAVPVSLSATAITLLPPASVLTGAGVTYPVYIDPTWHPVASNASAWTQVDSGFPGTSYWHEYSNLQVGKCPADITPPSQSCEGMGVARSFVRLPIPSALTSSSVINSADLYMTEDWAPSCTKTSVRLYTTGGISSSTTWNHQPSWASGYEWQDAAFGYPGCGEGYYKDDITWDVKSTITSDAGQQSTQTWGLRAADETDEYAWKTFWSGTNSLTLSVTYNDPPNKPGARSSSPGGSCQYPASDAPVIGDDDVTLYATASDDDGDNGLNTEFYLLSSSGSTVFTATDTTGDNDLADAVITRADFQAYSNNDGQEHTYHWYAITTDGNGLSSPAPADDCYFTYNPAAPGAPTVGLPSPAQGTLGQQIPVTFDAPAGQCPGNACPVSYTYQSGASTPTTVPASSGDWSGNITITRTGPTVLTVTAIAAGGNPGEPATPDITGLPPTTPYADGDFNGDGQPDLLSIGTSSTTTKYSLWLSPGTGPGTVGGPSDIGGAGTGISPGADGPADWNTADILHGDFTCQHVQDVMAYYPQSTAQAGTAVVLAGSGDGGPLQPFSGTSWQLLQDFQDPITGAVPQDLTAAGNASQYGTGLPDLIGIAGTTTSPDNYTLDLFTAAPDFCGNPHGYDFGTATVLSAQSPGGDSWANYTLATAQPGCYAQHTTTATGCDPGNAVLFALDTTTGKMWESTNPAESATSIVGTGNWQKITVPWGSSPPTQITGDVNANGTIEMWGTSGTNATAYTLACPSTCQLTHENSNTLTPAVHDDWPMSDGVGSTAADTIAGNDATLNNTTTGGATWNGGVNDSTSTFANYITLDGSTGYLTPPAGTIPPTDTTPKIIIWFRTTTPGGILVSLDGDPLPSSGGTGSTTSTYDPVLYIGTDGHLYGEWWNGSALSPAVSASPVDDGLWHRAVLTSYGTSQTLYVDNQNGVTINGTINIASQGSHLTFGAGYIGYHWPTEPHYNQNGSTGYADYFTGDIASTTYTHPNN
jgi:hypothetical protein